jgi:hypothetical protein
MQPALKGVVAGRSRVYSVPSRRLLIPTKSITQSKRRRSPDPIEAEHHVQPMPSDPSRSEATLVSGLLR